MKELYQKIIVNVNDFLILPAIIGEKTQENQGIQANVQYPYQLSLLPHTQFQRIRHGMLRKIFSAPSLKPLIILFMPISPIIAEVTKILLTNLTWIYYTKMYNYSRKCKRSGIRRQVLVLDHKSRL